jgi:hypothetical protein
MGLLTFIRTPDVNNKTIILSPVPAKPAPETALAFGEEDHYSDETCGWVDTIFLNKEQWEQKTASAGRAYIETNQDNSSEVGMRTRCLSEKNDETNGCEKEELAVNTETGKSATA